VSEGTGGDGGRRERKKEDKMGISERRIERKNTME
jgi:hypothetical protein